MLQMWEVLLLFRGAQQTSGHPQHRGEGLHLLLLPEKLLYLHRGEDMAGILKLLFCAGGFQCTISDCLISCSWTNTDVTSVKNGGVPAGTVVLPSPARHDFAAIALRCTRSPQNKPMTWTPSSAANVIRVSRRRKSSCNTRRNLPGK